MLRSLGVGDEDALAAAIRDGEFDARETELREALRAKATVGEVCHALRDVWGVYTPADAI